MTKNNIPFLIRCEMMRSGFITFFFLIESFIRIFFNQYLLVFVLKIYLTFFLKKLEKNFGHF